MIEMAPFGEDSATLDKQIASHQKLHCSLQRSQEVDRARDDLVMLFSLGSLLTIGSLSALFAV